MSDNTLQFQWIVTIKGGLEALFRDDPDVFVAGDLLWYPSRGRRPEIRTAPDALVAFGRPKGYRGSYMQWEEGGIAPQVVFEVLSPGNRAGEMAPQVRVLRARTASRSITSTTPTRNALKGYRRSGDELAAIPS